MARQTGAGTQLLGVTEVTYGTSPASGYFNLPFISSQLGSEQKLLESDVLGQGRDATNPFRDVITVDGDVVVPADLRNLGQWLKHLLGAPVTTGTTPKIHTFASGGATLPSMSIEAGFPATPMFNMIAGVVVDTMKMSWARSGLANVTFGCIGQGETKAASTAAGSPTSRTLELFSQFQGSISLNSSVLGGVVSGDLDFRNNFDRVEVIRSDGKIDGADPGLNKCTGSLVMRIADTTLLDYAIAGTAVQLDLSFTITANKKLVLTLPNVFLPKPKVSIPGPGGIQATFDWQAAKGVSSAMLTAVLTNDVTGY